LYRTNERFSRYISERVIFNGRRRGQGFGGGMVVMMVVL